MALVQTETVHGFAALPPLRQIGLMIGLAASVAIGVAVVLWSQQPNYAMLFGGLAQKEAAEVADALQKSGIPYRIDAGSGALLVPAERIHEARMKLAADGLPRAGGMELLGEGNGFGSSQFIEKARYQKALEQELARTISTLQNVRDARVHLAIPKRSVFLRKKEPPKASVVVDLYAGRSLDDGQVAAIVNLVAASVPRLAAKDVTVVDQAGTLLTNAGDTAQGLTSSQFAYNRKVEAAYAERIEDLLAPLVGAAAVRAQVAAELDFTQIEKTLESYDPDLPALRSEQVLEETVSSSNGLAQGVPGTLSNQPPGAGTTEPQTAEEGAPPAEPLNRTKRATRNYELDKTIAHIRLASGSVRRLSIAVVVDDKQTVDENGEVTRAPWTDEELAKFTTLVKEAVGFDETRGDSIQIVNHSFQPPPEAEPMPEPAIYEKPWFWTLVKQVVGGLGVLILIFGVIKPVMRHLAERGAAEQEAAMAAAQAAQAAALEGGEQAALAGPQGGQQLAAPQGPNYEEQVGQARNLVKEDPKRVAQLVKNWVSDDG